MFSSNSLAKRVSRLNAALDDFGVLSVGQLDGFLAAIAICPVPLPEGEWLPALLAIASDGVDPDSISTDQVTRLVDLSLEHYAATIGNLERRSYRPVFDSMPGDRTLLWEFWASGYSAALKLDPDRWTDPPDADTETLLAFAKLAILAAIATDSCPLAAEETETLTSTAADLIPDYVQQAYDGVGGLAADEDDEDDEDDFWLPSDMPVRVEKIGRNVPCPCGSGKKYRKCCGANWQVIRPAAARADLRAHVRWLGSAAPPQPQPIIRWNAGQLLRQRSSAASSSAFASTQRSPREVLSFFQNGARDFR